MSGKLSLSLKQTQSLMMTPQLQQAIKLLTLTHLEMTQVIDKEMQENPLLEEGLEVSKDSLSEVDYRVESIENQNKEATPDSFNDDRMNTIKEDFDWSKYISSYNSDSSAPPPSMAKPDSDEMPNYENMVSRGMTLGEHLEWQLRMEDLNEKEWSISQLIIHNIDEEGYLDADLAVIAEEAGVDFELAEEILRMVQHLDPVGCGARNLKECLMAQADQLIPRLPLVDLLIENHLEDIHKKNYTQISKMTGVDTDKIKDAEFIILSFHPKPGRLITPDETQYIVPDIYIHDMGGEFVVSLNEDGVPSLKVSNLYKTLMNAKDGEDKKIKEYVEEKMRAAHWLIKSIQNRKNTIMKVANAILKYQPEFFRKGAQYLRPMILKDIANEIGMHESTVSRVTTNKYMHTPIGTFELKYFFNAGVGGKNGGVDIASESLKLKIRQMILSENKKRPLSDQKIVEILSKEDIEVARRTVAKYREMMNILPSSKRKKLE